MNDYEPAPCAFCYQPVDTRLGDARSATLHAYAKVIVGLNREIDDDSANTTALTTARNRILAFLADAENPLYHIHPGNCGSTFGFSGPIVPGGPAVAYHPWCRADYEHDSAVDRELEKADDPGDEYPEDWGPIEAQIEDQATGVWYE